MLVKDLIKQLLDCDLDDDIYVAIYKEEDNSMVYYSIDGLESRQFEYRKMPTLATIKIST